MEQEVRALLSLDEDGLKEHRMHIAEMRESLKAGICQDTSKKLVRSLFIPEEPQQGLCPYASLPQDIFLT